MKKKDVWKILFLVLLTVNILFFFAIAVFTFLAGEEQPLPDPQAENQKKMSEFSIQTGKEDLNELINHYIEKENLNGPIEYSIVLSDEVELYGELNVFSSTLQLKMTFEAYALENGDLLLDQKSLSLGGIRLPVTQVLNIIRDAYKLPDWVLIQPSDKQIYVSLQSMRLSNGIQVRAEKFNLPENDIVMKMLVPVE
ncbi:YpmS family protein [Lederbergia sp. NSJ-179]|uniref:YpmS family protein n=1 Tax=Lederbergia sp. NSJ-179 TaxID=2931402 RepID=UPI001FD10690|nr:YpmS family protein [Lederbergia sp. NSJ-179]MCJ7841145.1 YpmS family protein [Lederbergia sp. NSJ-179]